MKNPIRTEHKQAVGRMKARVIAVSWRDLAVSIGPILLLAVVGVWLAIWFIRPAPPKTLTMVTGPKNSTFWNVGLKYREILARDGVTLNLIPTEGSLDNLRQLSAVDSKIDVGIVQGGMPVEGISDNLVSLGSIAYIPVSVFYRGAKGLDRLSALQGKRIAIGVQGSGSRLLALNLLKRNGIEEHGNTHLFDWGDAKAAQALIDNKIDAAFLMDDSVSVSTLGKLLKTPGVYFLDFAQADAYVRRFSYLKELTLPMGVLDLGKNIPDHDVHLMATTAELIAHDSLHPALSDLLIGAAKEVHGKANILQRADEFPAPLVQDAFPLSDDAARYYKSGKSFLYRFLPFWLASLLDRLLLVLVPVILLLIPAAKLVPLLYGWRIRSRIYRWYGALIALERGSLSVTEEEHAAMLRQLDQIEESVNHLKMPAAFAGQFYALREHISFVRARLAKHVHASKKAGDEGGEPATSTARS